MGELYDFVTNDVKKLYSDMVPFVKVTLVEAGPSLLGPFDKQLQTFTQSLFGKRGIDVRLECSVTSVESYEEEGFRFPPRRAVLSDGSKLPFGTLVWSAGLKPVKFTDSLDDVLPKAKNGRILIDDYLRVKGHEGSIWVSYRIGNKESNV